MAKYNKNFKMKIIKYVLQEKHFCGEASRTFNVAKSEIMFWVKYYEKGGIAILSEI